MTNIYIDEGTREDMHNDCMVVITAKTAITEAVQRLQALERSQAMAYNCQLLTDIIHKMDDILAGDLNDIEQSLTQADDHFYRLDKEPV